MSTGPDHLDASGLPDLMHLAGDEAILPAGIRLSDEERPGRQCFVILEGSATVERHGHRLRSLSSGAFVGHVDADGRPLAPRGVTVRIDARSRVLVIDPARLAALLDAEPAWAGAWRSRVSGL